MEGRFFCAVEIFEKKTNKPICRVYAPKGRNIRKFLESIERDFSRNYYYKRDENEALPQQEA